MGAGGAITFRHVEPKAWQEYLEAVALANLQPDEPRRMRMLVRAWAELQYRMHGGGKCSVCRASVRHVLPVTVERKDGTHRDFDCLCTRCLVAEEAVSRGLSIKAGPTILHYAPKGEPTPTDNHRVA